MDVFCYETQNKSSILCKVHFLFYTAPKSLYIKGIPNINKKRNPVYLFLKDNYTEIH
jgi:hypothetical protein